MAEESYSDEEVELSDDQFDINDTIDEVVFGDSEEAFLLPDESMVKDDLDTRKKLQDEMDRKAEERRLEKAEQEKEFQAETDKFSKELKKKAQKQKFDKFWFHLFYIFKPSNWVKALQVFEPFIIALFVDLQLIIIIFSLLYIMYIILNVDAYSHFSAIFRISGTVSLVILCIVIQLNAGNEPTNKEE